MNRARGEREDTHHEAIGASLDKHQQPLPPAVRTQWEDARAKVDKQVLALEVQLERVSSSCMTVQAYSERIEAMQTQMNTMEEKILNCGRIGRRR